MIPLSFRCCAIALAASGGTDDDDWFLQGVFGGDITLRYTDQDRLILGGEYFDHQGGNEDASLYRDNAHAATTPVQWSTSF